MHVAKFFETPNDKRLEQDQRHLLRQSALMQLEFRSDNDDRTTRVINALSKQVLPETSTLALEHIAERFERAIPGASHGAAMAPVIKQGVHCFLQHPFLVSNDHFRSFQLKQVPQTIVP